MKRNTIITVECERKQNIPANGMVHFAYDFCAIIVNFFTWGRQNFIQYRRTQFKLLFAGGTPG